jgi:hypothetical protein
VLHSGKYRETSSLSAKDFASINFIIIEVVEIIFVIDPKSQAVESLTGSFSFRIPKHSIVR